MAQLTKNQELDFKKYFVERGDEGFNPERNKAVIEGTILKYEAQRRAKQRDYVEQIKERADAVVTYLKSQAADANRPVEKYFSRQELARLRGQKILQKIIRLKNGKTIIRLDEA